MSRNRLYAIATSAAILGSSIFSLPAHAVDINDLFVFGDSYSDTGAYVKLTNGETAVWYLAQEYGITLTTSKTPDPGTDGVNFAQSGARVFVGPTPPATQPLSLTQQVAQFEAYVNSGDVVFNPSTSLFFLLGGLNDHNLVTSAQVNAATEQQVETLYSLGARVFEIALLPADIPGFTDSAANLNPGYEALVPELQAMFPDATFGLSNWGPDYDQILNNPSEYGLTNTTDPCDNLFANPPAPVCSTPDQYFYYYNSHPSDAVHKIVGSELYAEVQGLPSPVPEPSTWAMMLLGFLGLGFAGYRSAKAKAIA
jgi:phospholipase/lecithinase/hemolysin